MKHLTAEQKKYIIENFSKKSCAEIAKDLNESYYRVHIFSRKRKLKRTDAELKKILSNRSKKGVRIVRYDVPHYEKRNYQLHEWI